MDLATAFYEHLYTWGSRSGGFSRLLASPPVVELMDGATVRVSSAASSGSYAIATLLAGSRGVGAWSPAGPPHWDGGPPPPAVLIDGLLFRGLDLRRAAEPVLGRRRRGHGCSPSFLLDGDRPRRGVEHELLPPPRDRRQRRHRAHRQL